VGGTLFFSAYDDTPGTKLWKSDGTEAGTARVRGDVYTSSLGLIAFGGKVYFLGYDTVAGYGLWKSDGTEEGTIRVKGVAPTNLTAAGGTLFFMAYDAMTGHGLWKSDGTEDGTQLLKGGWSYPYPYALTAVGGTLFFVAYDAVTGYGLWRSDGTEDGTVHVKDVPPAIDLAAMGGTLFFTAPGTTNRELWKSDGTEDGTIPIKEIVIHGLAHLIPVGGTMFFTNSEEATGAEPWKSDGTEAGTVLVKDIWPGPSGSSEGFPYAPRAARGRLFFGADDGVHGNELWVLAVTGDAQVEQLLERVRGLELPPPFTKLFEGHLQRALVRLGAGNNGLAILNLAAFTLEVRALRGRKISEADADVLIAAAEDAIAEIRKE